jgi:hypothetical protein
MHQDSAHPGLFGPWDRGLVVARCWFPGGRDHWLNARETVSITRTITAHARLTFQDIETNVSVFRISMGFVALLLGLTAWAVLLVFSSRAEEK